eukprot:TRINITY_DN3375_c0_g1_i2.p1 TRINITY_DN3375_c0_g1~~TRINITY_DN3375_c0_g1_i2.p1  ORF type:complete len:506 (+),score=95.28 TRINITY_DN3375_c0_g1_i2:53-1570(+)
MFVGINGYFVQFGIGSIQLDIIKCRFEQQGGYLMSSPVFKNNPKSKNYIFTGTSYENLLQKYESIASIPNYVHICNIDWISICLSTGIKTSTDDYILRHTTNEKGVQSNDLKEDTSTIVASKKRKGYYDYQTDFPKRRKLSGQWLQLDQSHDVGNSYSSILDFDIEDIQHHDQVVETKETYELDKESGSSDTEENMYEIEKYQNAIPEKEKSQRNYRRQYFACQNSPEKIKKTNLNAHITDVLTNLENNCHSQGQKWRAFAYGKSIRILRNLSYKINTTEQVKRLYGIGDSISEKIEEILSTGKLRRVEEENNDEMTKTLNLFARIFGAGPKTARKWYAKGYRDMDDLIQYADLTRQQAIGIKLLNDFDIRIPREEAEKLYNIVLQTANTIDKNIILAICGSYRRGKPDCGDIDILITYKYDPMPCILPQILRELHRISFLTHDLTSINEDTDKYMGVCKLPKEGSIHRRIDIKAITKSEWACALLYFTGSDHFNRSMRLWYIVH